MEENDRGSFSGVAPLKKSLFKLNLILLYSGIENNRT